MTDISTGTIFSPYTDKFVFNVVDIFVKDHDIHCESKYCKLSFFLVKLVVQHGVRVSFGRRSRV